MAIPRPKRAEAPAPTVVVEDGTIPRRLRRPLDLVRFAVAILAAALTVLIAYFASGTSNGIAQDITGATGLLPSILVLLFNIIGGIGTIALPVAVAISLVIRHRLRQLFDSLLGLLIAVVVLTGTAYLIRHYGPDRFILALAGSTLATSAATAPILGGLTTFVTVARLSGRRPWNVISGIVIVSLFVVLIISGGITIAGLLLSFFVGWALGLLVRYALGTPTTRPSGVQVAEALARGGFALERLEASQTLTVGRRYRAITLSGAELSVTVLDRDLEGAGLVTAAWSALRLRDEPGRGAFNMRRAVDHAALMSYASASALAPVPRLVLASEIGSDSSLLAYESIAGTRFSDLPAGSLTDVELEGAWRAMRTLHENQIAHRTLTSDHLFLGSDGTVWLLGAPTGSVAASDVSMRIDVAELLCTLALLTDSDTAVRTGRRVLGVSTLARALPVLQPVALSPATRKEMKSRKRKDLMIQLRDSLVEIRPDAAVEQINLRRIRPRTLIMLVVGTVAAYVLLYQLASVDLVDLFTRATWWWIAIGVLASIATYFGAAWSLSGFVPERLSLPRTVLAQLAGDFATLVSPPTLGVIAINVRYLQKAGLHPALAAASVGVSQVAAFVAHILLLIGFGIAAGTQKNFHFDPPQWAVILVIALVLAILAAFAVPRIRRFAFGRLGPILREVVPRLITVAQRPWKLVEGIGGILLLNMAYIIVLWSCVQAFGGELNFAAIAVVYLAGATLGQAAPTPGGLGAVEAALAGGLTIAGLDSGIAISAVLLFRLITFWIPTLPGYISFNWLTKQGAL